MEAGILTDVDKDDDKTRVHKSRRLERESTNTDSDESPINDSGLPPT